MNKELFQSLFKVGDVIDSGGDPTRKNAARLSINAIDDEMVRYQSLKNKQKNHFRYSYLEIVLKGFDRINPRSIQPTIQQVFVDAGEKKNYSTENYVYGFAKEVRRRLGSAFSVTYGEQVSELLIDDLIDTGTGGGQGFATTAAVRKSIEDHSMRIAITHFESHGFVCHVHGKPFDILATRGDEILYVEVKGTQTAGSTVLLTNNEVLHNARQDRTMALFIVSGIKVSSAGKASEGEISLISPWSIQASELSAVTWMYRVPEAEA